MEVRRMVCINCPMGCSLEVSIDGDNISVKGNTCPRGEKYAISEVRDPRRIVTSTVRVEDGARPVVSVKTDREIPKGMIFDVMKEINRVKVKSPVKRGQVIIENVLGTGSSIVATCDD